MAGPARTLTRETSPQQEWASEAETWISRLKLIKREPQRLNDDDRS
jgi:hypothetical protein